MSRTFVIADTHFNHTTILTYEPSRRAWGCGTVEEMDRVLVDAWNSIININNLIIHMGNFHMGTQEHGRTIRAQLAGRILLVRGNHDHRHPRWLLGHDQHTSRAVLDTAVGTLVLRHNPARFTREDLALGHLLVHGHLHSRAHRESTWSEVRDKAACVSVERVGPAPVAIEDLFRVAARQHGAGAGDRFVVGA